MKTHYFVDLVSDYNDITGNAVIRHTRYFLLNKGYKAISLKWTDRNNFLLKIYRFIQVFYWIAKIRKGSKVLFHLPIQYRAIRLLQNTLKWKKIETIGLIHDINGLRYEDNNLLKNEIRTVKKFSWLIVHNDKMQRFVSEFYPTERIHILWLFDYYSKNNNLIEREFSFSCAIAANFDKGTYINSLVNFFFEKRLQLHLYGSVPTALTQSLISQNINIHGPIHPDSLPIIMAGSFGIIWDGNSLNTCNGSYGHYLLYNTPHKLSAYLAAGMPIIIWAKSAMASWVLEKNVGILIYSLNELEEKLSEVTSSQYQQMHASAKEIGKLLCQGHFLNKVLDIIEQKTLD